jgi:DNA-binding response OmpR family regulator
MTAGDDHRVCPLCGNAVETGTEIRFDAASGLLLVRGQPAQLALTDRNVFAALWDARPRTLTYDQVLETAWRGARKPTEQSVHVSICKLRPLLAGSGWKIETNWGIGVRLVRES